MIISNIKSDNINNIRRSCIDLSIRIGKDVNPRVSFDVAQIKGKAFMSVQNLMTEKNKGIFLKLTRGKDNASMLLAKGKDQKLQTFIRKSPQIVSKKIDEMSIVLKRASRDEAKSLTDFNF